MKSEQQLRDRLVRLDKWKGAPDRRMEEAPRVTYGQIKALLWALEIDRSEWDNENSM